MTRGLLLHYGPNIRPHQALLSGWRLVQQFYWTNPNTLLAPLQLCGEVALGGEISLFG